MKVVEMRILRWLCENTIREMIKNEHIRYKIEVALIKDNMQKSRLRWFSYEIILDMLLLTFYSISILKGLKMLFDIYHSTNTIVLFQLLEFS